MEGEEEGQIVGRKRGVVYEKGIIRRFRYGWWRRRDGGVVMVEEEFVVPRLPFGGHAGGGAQEG